MKMKIALLVFPVLSAVYAIGCECVPVSPNEAKKLPEVVFRGTITDISRGKVTFRVDRIWKGDPGRTFEMPEFTQRGGACIGFRSNLLVVGNDVVVFAARLRRYPGDNEYFTSICTRTSLSYVVGDTLARLGKSRPPRGVY